MLGSVLQALLARLCLFVAVLTGVSPSQELVLCFEPDGTIALEVPGANRTCDPRGESGQGQDVRAVSDGQCCACTDIAIGERSEEVLVQPSKATVHFDASVAMAPVTLVRPQGNGTERRKRVDALPEPPGVLAHIRTIELRV
jgi:hypothetical protein